jgi:hypothetical protein
VKISDIYLAGSAQFNYKVLQRCTCAGLGLRCLSPVADVWPLYTQGSHLDVGQTPLIGWLLQKLRKRGRKHGHISVR